MCTFATVLRKTHKKYYFLDVIKQDERNYEKYSVA